MRDFIRLLKLIAPNWKACWGSTVLAVGTVSTNVGLLAVSAFLISCAALHPPVLDLMTLIVAVRFFGISRAVCRYLERYVSHATTFRILKELRIWFYGRIECLAPAVLNSHRSGELLNHAVGCIETLQNFYLRVLAPPLTAVFILLGTFIFLAWFELKLALAFAAFYLLAVIAAPLLVTVLSRGIGRQTVHVKAGLDELLVDCVQGMSELKVYEGTKRYLDRVKNLGQDFVKLQGQAATLTGLSNALTGLLANLALWAILVLTIPLVEEGRLEGTYLAMLALAAFASFEATYALPQVSKHLEESLTAARQVFRLSDAEPVFKDVEQARLLKPQEFSLRVENLSFRYQASEPLVLDNINLDLPQGERIAIVGPSGAGKSSLINLLLRFWDYEAGSIFLGGKELKEYSFDEVRNMFSVVSQKTHLFNTTIAENLLLARPLARKEELIEACKKAHIHDFILSLPQGYDTYVGENGYKLSGGQRQRLAIARAVLKKAPILILDEATSGLDAVTERQIMQDLIKLMEGRTTLIITHRLVGLAAMEQILVLKEGRVVEQGREEELLAGDSFYGRMWRLQYQVLAKDGELC